MTQAFQPYCGLCAHNRYQPPLHGQCGPGSKQKQVPPVTATTFLELGYDGARSIGFSGRKTEYAIGLAEAEVSGALNFDAIARMPDEDAIETLTALRGIGRWTAEVYLIFALGRPDVWPAADIALVAAAGRIRGLAEKPSFKEASAIAEEWRPWRGAAAILLWHYYRTMPQ